MNIDLKHIEFIKREVEETLKNDKKTKLKVVAGLAAGAGIYMMGKTNGMKLGHAKGLAKGYHLGVSEVTEFMGYAKSKIVK